MNTDSAALGDVTRARLLNYLRTRQTKGERPPSYREITEAMGFGSTQTAHHHVQMLIKEGKLKVLAGARGIFVPNAGLICPICHGSGRI